LSCILSGLYRKSLLARKPCVDVIHLDDSAGDLLRAHVNLDIHRNIEVLVLNCELSTSVESVRELHDGCELLTRYAGGPERGRYALEVGDHVPYGL